MFKEWIADYLRRKFVTGVINRNDRMGILHRSWGHVFSNFICGDYLEFGVYRGDTLVKSYRNYLQFVMHAEAELRSSEIWRHPVAKKMLSYVPCFHGLDTFEGMPDNEEKWVAYSKGNFLGDIEKVKKICADAGLIKPQLFLYKGLFRESKENLYRVLNGRMAAIINVDCDLYRSSQDALAICAPLIQVGTVLLLDDYNAFAADQNRGTRRAFQEFCEMSEKKFEKWIPYHFVGQAFLCVG